MSSTEKRGTVVGVDGCPAGWVCFEVDLQSRRTAIRVLANLSELISASPEPKLIAIDIPIGIPTSGARACDIAARKLLGKPRSNSVFPAPIRATFAAKTYQEACALSLQAQGKSLSRQAFEIIPKIREVDDLITPELQMRIFEVHPEVSFRALNGGQSLKHRKLDREGKEERLKLLLPHYLRSQVTWLNSGGRNAMNDTRTTIQLLTVGEAAQLLRLAPKTLYSLVSQRRIPYRKAGRRLLFCLTDLIEWTRPAERRRRLLPQ